MFRQNLPDRLEVVWAQVNHCGFPAPISRTPRLRHGLDLPRIPAAIGDHQPVPLRQRLSRLELVHLVEHEGKAGAGVWRLAHEPFVGIAQIGGMIQQGER